jgi:hypothetical protein
MFPSQVYLHHRGKWNCIYRVLNHYWEHFSTYLVLDKKADPKMAQTIHTKSIQRNKDLNSKDKQTNKNRAEHGDAHPSIGEVKVRGPEFEEFKASVGYI